MKITDIVAVQHKAATDMQAFAARNRDLDLPDLSLGAFHHELPD
jgi:hypothetical protein